MILASRVWLGSQWVGRTLVKVKDCDNQYKIQALLKNGCLEKTNCHTSESFHPGGFVNSQVVDHYFHDASQELVEMIRGDICTQVTLHLWKVLQSSFPPTRKIVTQHGQSDLDHMWHFCIASSRFGQISNLFHEDV